MEIKQLHINHETSPLNKSLSNEVVYVSCLEAGCPHSILTYISEHAVFPADLLPNLLPIGDVNVDIVPHQGAQRELSPSILWPVRFDNLKDGIANGELALREHEEVTGHHSGAVIVADFIPYLTSSLHPNVLMKALTSL